MILCIEINTGVSECTSVVVVDQIVLILLLLWLCSSSCCYPYFIVLVVVVVDHLVVVDDVLVVNHVFYFSTEFPELTEDYVQDIKTVWNMPIFKEVWKARSGYQINDSSAKFIERIDQVIAIVVVVVGIRLLSIYCCS